MIARYDFAVFGGLASVLGDVFFPSSNRVASLMEALAVRLAAGELLNANDRFSAQHS